MVFDTVGGDTQERAFQTLKRGGVLVSTLNPPSEEKAKEFGVTAAMVMATPKPDQLAEIKDKSILHDAALEILQAAEMNAFVSLLEELLKDQAKSTVKGLLTERRYYSHELNRQLNIVGNLVQGGQP